MFIPRLKVFLTIVILLALLLFGLSSCGGYSSVTKHYRTENYKIKKGQTPAQAYKKYWNSHLK